MKTLPSKLYSVQQTRELDRLAQELPGISGFTLMTKAAEAGYQAIQKYYPAVRKIAIICGAGNNAGDGYLIAAIALQADYHVQLISLVAPEKLTGDAGRAMMKFVAAGGMIQLDIHQLEESNDLIIDAILGTGLGRRVQGLFADAIRYINTLDVPVLAVDIPSGLNADTGNVMGCAIYASKTISFIALKKGLFTGLSADYCGDILFSNCQVPNVVFNEILSTECLISPPRLKPRDASAHKGHFGHVLVVGGDYGYAGAVHLAAEAALNTGAGLVSIATRKEHAQQVHLLSPELMGHSLEQLSDIDELLAKATVLVFGPGLGQREWAKKIWAKLIALEIPRVIDADALNLLAAQPHYADNWILTPHPGEAARLLQCSTADILQDRYLAVHRIQRRYGGVCVLKGAGTLISAGAHVYVNSTGNPGMASGGMGDVLSGLIGSLLAQRYSLLEAAKTGVYLHGLAADNAARNKGERGLRASDVIQCLTRVVN